MANANESATIEEDELQGIEWESVSFIPDASVLKKILSYATFGYFPYKEPKRILHNVYGNIKCGELVALMGPSGAGKSSLMKCLTEGICYTGFRGTISSHGIHEKIRTSIIHQDEKEHLILGLTVRETLMYASQLKNRYWCPPGNNFHEENVQQLLVHLGLDNKAENPVSKCSGGERKRIAIGVELTEKNKPHILFLDEPTTGLDSSVAYSVIKALKGFATMNRMAVVSTIHQPSEEILNVFDKAIMLTGTGAILYHDNPSVDNLRAFLSWTIPELERRGKDSFNCFQNPADVMIGIASALKRGQEGNEGDKARAYTNTCCQKLTNICLLRCTADDFKCCSIPFLSSKGAVVNREDEGQRLCERPFFEREEVQQVCKNMIELTSRNYSQNQRLPDVHKKDYSNTGLLCRTTSVFSYFSLYGFWTLLKRTWKLRVVLGKRAIILRLLAYLLVISFTTSMYGKDIGLQGGCLIVDEDPLHRTYCNRTCFDSKEDIQNETTVTSNIKLIFFFLLFLSLESLLNVALTFPTEFKLFLHEFRNGWYSTPSYFLAKFLVEIPGQLVIPTAYSIYFYVYTQQEDFGIAWGQDNGTPQGERFKIYLRATYLSGFIAQGLGFLIGILCVDSLSRAILLSAGTVLGLSFFSGFFKKKAQMSDSEEFVTEWSFVRYGLETMLLSIYGRGRCTAPETSYAMVAFGLKDNDLHDNWMGFIRIFLVTWGLTFVILQLKASKWYFFKLIRKVLVATFEFVERWGIYLYTCCRCGVCFNYVKGVLRDPLRKVLMIVRCVYIACIWYFVILGVLPVAVYIAVMAFHGTWS